MKNVARPKTKTEKPEPENTTTTPPWSASTTCSACGDYVPCGCEARAKPPTPAPAQEGNLCACLVTLAAWRRCHCGSLTLFVDSQARTDSDFTCGLCQAKIEDLARRLRYVKCAERVRFHLSALFSTANDNHEARA